LRPIALVGVLLIVGGIAALVLGEIRWTKRETLVQIGDAKIEAESQDRMPLPRIAGIAAVVAGVALVAVGYRRR